MKKVILYLTSCIFIACMLYTFCYGSRLGSNDDRFSSSFWDTSANGVVSTVDTDIMFVQKTIIKTIDVNVGDSTDDFQFDDTAANTSEQPVDLGAIIPAYAEIVSVQLRCLETVTGSASMGIDLGTATGGNQLHATANVDTVTDIYGTETGNAPKIEAANAAKHVWVNATPGANWNTLVAGRWSVMVTYIDYDAVNTQKN